MSSLYEKEIIHKTCDFIRDVLSDRDWSHGFDHALEVVKNIIHIWHSCSIYLYRWPNACEGNPLTIAIVAGLLHDVCDHKYTSYLTDELLIRMDLFLVETLGEHDTTIVRKIIDNVSFSKELRGEIDLMEPHVQFLRDIVSDSDKLEAIGEIGVDRCLAYQAEIADSGSNTNDIVINSERHIRTTLLLLYPTFFRTMTGENLAKPRHEYMLKWVNDL
jgi:HD superfamily phosphodiesterase